jgi:hypothetical protein
LHEAANRRARAFTAEERPHPEAGARLEAGARDWSRRATGAGEVKRACGRGEKIRTSDPLHPMQVRYQAALRPDRAFDYTLRGEGSSSSSRICSSSSRSAVGDGGADAATLVALCAERAAARGSAVSESSRCRAPLMVKPCS